MDKIIESITARACSGEIAPGYRTYELLSSSCSLQDKCGFRYYVGTSNNERAVLMKVLCAKCLHNGDITIMPHAHTFLQRHHIYLSFPVRSRMKQDVSGEIGARPHCMMHSSMGCGLRVKIGKICCICVVFHKVRYGALVAVYMSIATIVPRDIAVQIMRAVVNLP
jgi:hypothetical protein